MTDLRKGPDGLLIVAELTARGDELGDDGYVPVPRLLSWLEHARWQSVTLNADAMGELFTGGRMMVVRGQRALFHQPVGLGQALAITIGLSRVGTSSVELAQSMWLVGDSPQRVAEARIVGVALGPDRRPTPIGDVLRDHVHPMPEVAGLTALQVTDVAGPAFVWPTPVRPSEIDVFQHVNHARYAEWFDDARRLALRASALDSTFSGRVTGIALDYVREVVLGESVDVALQPLQPHELAVDVRVGQEVRARGRLHLAGPN